MIDTLHEIFPNQYLFLSFFFILTFGVVATIRIILNSAQTTKLVQVAVKYFENKKQNSQYFLDMLSELNEKYKLEQEKNMQLIEMVNRHEKTIMKLESKLKEYESTIKKIKNEREAS